MGKEVIEKCSFCGNERGLKHNTPFVCKECGGIYFQYKPIRDIVFIYPDPVSSDTLFNGIIVLPESVKANLQAKINTGTVLAVGKGYWDKKKKRFYYTELKVGDRVIFDESCPWWIDVEASDGRMYLVRYMGEKDIKLIIEEKDDCLL